MNRRRGYAAGARTREHRMSFPDDDRPKPKPVAYPGENLAELSLDELKARIALYRDEIARLEGEMARKQASLQAAQSFFR
jgi:uncharacterized small protein (DUF1192 family)